MKKWIPLLLVLCLLFVACGEKAETPKKEEPVKKAEKPEPKKDPRAEKLAKFGAVLKEKVKVGVEIPDEELTKLAELLRLVLPETTGDLAGFTWDVSCSKNKDENDMLFAVELNRMKGEEKEQAMWFHILYNAELPQNERDEYGTEVFEGYRATVAENAHIWILVNNMEIRAVADAEDFKNNDKIKAVLKAFKLKDIEAL